MKNVFLIIFLFSSFLGNSQDSGWFRNFDKKGHLFGYWGYNRSVYSRSNIHFQGQQYNFSLSDVKATDRPTPFNMKDYFSSASITIPQYNMRFGFFLTKKWSISGGVDHMKYVMIQDQTVPIEGYIKVPGSTHNGIYNRQPKQMTEDFLKFEHTDGLNYISIEAEYHDNLYTFNKKHALNFYAGPGVGLLVPRSNVTLLNFPRYDEFHVAGYGLSAKVGIQAVIWKYITLNFESKSGFISMQDILTTGANITDRSRQTFWFTELMGTVGFVINLSSSK